MTALITLALAAPALGLPGLGAKKAASVPPCTASAKACVDLGSQRAWLMSGGEVTHGPASISSGGDGKETPTGTFSVGRKVKDHVSKEYGTPMPYAVFFAPGGIAFHEGDLGTPSGGCIRLEEPDAIAFFNILRIGDEVQVH